MSNFSKPPVPKTAEELSAAIEEVMAGVYDEAVEYDGNPDGYGKCVIAMARAAYMAHEYVAHALHVSGWQHSNASLVTLGLIRNYSGPFMVLDGSEALYPQYDLRDRVDKWLDSEDTRTWLADTAANLIKEAHEKGDESWVAARVMEYWEHLVATRPTPEEKTK